MPHCGGTRWSFQARALRIGDKGIHHLLAEPFVDFAGFSDQNGQFAKTAPTQASALLRVLHHHASAFVSVGLGHLTGDRGMLEVSEGESRRARLAAVLNSRDAGLCMLLDEPARGLHDEDVQSMADAIRELARTHTVVMNEHRHSLVRAADHVIELGPGAEDTAVRSSTRARLRARPGPTHRPSSASACQAEGLRIFDHPGGHHP